jgi:hypothetical protein
VTGGELEVLKLASQRTVSLAQGDKRWKAVAQLQKADFVRLKWSEGKVATLVVTDAGKTALAKEWK